MKWLRLLPLLAMLALLMAPFGRMAAAEAMPVEPALPSMAAHCAEQAPLEQDRTDGNHKSTVNCLMACAAIAVAEGAASAPMQITARVVVDYAPPEYVGRHPEADPPPPRRA